MIKTLQSVLRKYWNTSWRLILWASTGTIWDIQLSSFFQDHFTRIKPLEISIKSHFITVAHRETTNKKNIYVTLHWLNLMFWWYQYTTPQQLQMLNYYNDNTLKSMHYTCTTWNFQAIILLSLRNNYKAYNQQAITFQSQAYTYTTYNLQAITFQPIRYTYTTYDLKSITFQSLCYTYATFSLQAKTFQSLRWWMNESFIHPGKKVNLHIYKNEKV